MAFNPPQSMQMAGPPAAPPETPTLSAFQPGAGPSGASAGPLGGGPSPAGRMEAIPKLVFMVDQLLDTLARAVPGASEEIDQAKSLIRGVLAKALQGGPTGTPTPTGPGPQGSPVGAGPIGR